MVRFVSRRMACALLSGFTGTVGVATWGNSFTFAREAAQGGGEVELVNNGVRVWPPSIILDDDQLPISSDLPDRFTQAKFFAGDRVSEELTDGPITMNWKLFQLADVLPVSHNTLKFVFRFKDPNEVYHLPACSTMQLGIRLPDGTGAFRLYTPITENGALGGFECIVKRYEKGCFTPELFKMQKGDWVYGRFQHLKMKYKEGEYKNVGCIAAGTGIAPCLQVIRAALADTVGFPKVSLLYTNTRQKDILLKDELDQLMKTYPDRFNVTYALTEPPLGWEGEVGYVTHASVNRTMPPPGKGNTVCVSGPDSMMEIVAGVSIANTIMWKNVSENQLPNYRARQVAAPTANTMGSMRQGILYECGYTDEEVYRF